MKEHPVKLEHLCSCVLHGQSASDDIILSCLCPDSSAERHDWQQDFVMQDVLALGAIFATTDSVAVLQVLDKDRSPILFSLVFGEGVINDAAGVALLRAIQVSADNMAFCRCLKT